MANYATVAEGDTYCGGRLNTDGWDTATEGNKTKALTQATRIIDRLRYKGSRTDTDQVNQFPRDDDTTVPDDIKNACIEIAIALLDGVDPEKEYENIRLGSQSYGPVRSTYKDKGYAHLVAGVPSVTAWRYLLPYLDVTFEVNLHRVN